VRDVISVCSQTGLTVHIGATLVTKKTDSKRTSTHRRLLPVTKLDGEAARLLGEKEAKALAARAPTEMSFLQAVITAAAKRVDRVPEQTDRTLLERATNEAPSGLFVFDGEGKFEFVNRSGESLCGIAAEELRGKTIAEALGAGALSSQLGVIVERARSGKAPLEYEISYALPSGARFDVGFTAALVGESALYEDGEVVVVARDLHAPAERLKLRTPASLTAEQQADLRNRLRQVERQMARSEKLVAVGQMAAGFVHEINNPLGALSGLIQILQMELDDADPTREMLEEVAGELDRIHRIADSMLELARSSSGEGSEAFAAVNLGELAKSVLRLMGPQLRVARVKHEICVEEGPLWALGDADRLKQVLMNLILNAAQAMSPADMTPPPGGKIVLSIAKDIVKAEDLPPRPTRAQDLAGRGPDALREEAGKRVAGEQAPPWKEDLPLVRIEVRDNGPGLPEDRVGRIFEPFFTTKPPGEGTGLGLSTVEAIVRAHGGTVRAYNGEAGGAVFSIRLPASAPPK
jgi:PAS domain S-box-containing protein